MNRYIVIRRLRGPAFLLLIGVIALLNQMDILSWGHAWPLFLIMLGVFALAERAAMASEPPMPGGPYGGTPYPGGPYPNAPYPGAPTTTPPAQTGTSIVPAHSDRDPNGGQL